jgi:hypothetical protein
MITTVYQAALLPRGLMDRKKARTYVRRILLFLFYSYVKSHLDNDIWIPIYKTIPAICNTPRQTQCIPNSIFPHFIMVIMMCCGGPSCGLWFVVVCWCAK